MTNEDLLKSYILSEYRSVREFCLANDFAYSTVSSIFRRGILGSSVSLMIKICDKLGIDIDELVNGKIVKKVAAILKCSRVARSRERPSVRIWATLVHQIETYPNTYVLSL